jgi:hypothetical protein
MVYMPNMLKAQHKYRQILSLEWHVHSEIHLPLNRQVFPYVFMTQLLYTVHLTMKQCTK